MDNGVMTDGGSKSGRGGGSVTRATMIVGGAHRRRSNLRLLRQGYIGLAIAVFLVYCWASVAYQNQVAVPDYKPVSVDLLGGKTRAQWDAEESERFSRLMILENKRYQLPADARITLRGEDGEDRVVGPDMPLTSGDFAAVIAQSPPGGGVVMALRDPTAIYALEGENYLLRDAIYDPANPDEPPLINFAERVDKRLIDSLRGLGVNVITITGHGSPVGFDPGTAIMLAIIFFALVAALKPVLWDPFQALLDRRQKELDMGSEAARSNQAETARLEEERVRRNAALAWEIQAERMRRRQETAREAEAVVSKAKREEKAARHLQLQDLGESADRAGLKLREDAPELAEAIVDAVLGREGGAGEGKKDVSSSGVNGRHG